jgi:membrane protein
VRQPKLRFLSLGAFLAILVWVAASLGFAFYVANFASYNATYGSVGGVIVALLWLWLTNNALLFGAEIDTELERARELAAGEVAEVTIQLPVRDDRGIRKAEERRRKDVEAGRRVRESFGHRGDPADRPFVRR